jgi:hypothetical protein
LPNRQFCAYILAIEVTGDTMTASPENARAAFRLLQEGLEELGHTRLLDVAATVGKCVDSLADQVAFYEGQKQTRTAEPADLDLIASQGFRR